LVLRICVGARAQQKTNNKRCCQEKQFPITINPQYRVIPIPETARELSGFVEAGEGSGGRVIVPRSEVIVIKGAVFVTFFSGVEELIVYA